MPSLFHKYAYTFFWSFERLDNTTYNFIILEKLFQAKGVFNSSYFNKPIITTTVSIIECILYDFIKRITEFRNEVVPGLDPEAILFAKNKMRDADYLDRIIAYIKKHDVLLQATNTKLYTDLDTLRIMRNRLHIQNKRKQLDKDERYVWGETEVHLATSVLETICGIMCYAHPRPNRELIPFDNFPRPWL